MDETLDRYAKIKVPDILISVDKGDDRCLYFFTVGDKAIVTNGVIKKTQKTPQEVIDLAEKYRADYERRSVK